MLVGYVSDERYLAVSDCALLFEQGSVSIQARSLANGAVYADLSPGIWKAALNKPGYGAKWIDMDVDPELFVNVGHGWFYSSSRSEA